MASPSLSDLFISINSRLDQARKAAADVIEAVETTYVRQYTLPADDNQKQPTADKIRKDIEDAAKTVNEHVKAYAKVRCQCLELRNKIPVEYGELRNDVRGRIVEDRNSGYKIETEAAELLAGLTKCEQSLITQMRVVQPTYASNADKIFSLDLIKSAKIDDALEDYSETDLKTLMIHNSLRS